jgi:hypothetical protein
LISWIGLVDERVKDREVASRRIEEDEFDAGRPELLHEQRAAGALHLAHRGRGAAAKRDCAIALTATELIPSAERPVAAAARNSVCQILLDQVLHQIILPKAGFAAFVRLTRQPAYHRPSASKSRQRPADDAQIALAAMFTVSASSAALKMNDTTLWPNTVRRIGLQLTVTSDTCAHIPMVKAK